MAVFEAKQMMELDMKQVQPASFIPTLENVRANYARQHIPDILELGPLCGTYYLVVERGAPISVQEKIWIEFPEAAGTRWNNALIVTEDGSMALRYSW
jgi:hypothetical protein